MLCGVVLCCPGDGPRADTSATGGGEVPDPNR